MYESPPDSGHCVELYVRSFAPGSSHGLQDAVLRRLRELVDVGRLDGMRLHVWGDSICPESAAARTAAGEFVLDRVSTFVAWARANGFTPRSCLRATDVCSTLADVEYTAIRFPQMLLAEFRDGELLFLSPCGDTARSIAVLEHLDALSDGELPVPDVSPQALEEEGSGTDPVGLREALGGAGVDGVDEGALARLAGEGE